MSEGLESSEGAADDGGVAGGLLAELEAGGALVDEGGFTIDGAQARHKLREFLLADAHAYVLLLVEAAVLGGADPIDVEIGAAGLHLELGAIRFDREELEHLFSAVYIELDGSEGAERRRRRALQKVAYACNAALRLADTQAIVIESGALRLRLTPEDDRGLIETIETIETIEPPRPVTHVRVEVSALSLDLTNVSREEQLVRERCEYSPTATSVNGERVSQGLRFALHVELGEDELSFSTRVRKARDVVLDGRAIGFAGLRYSGKLPAEVTILTNGVLAERLLLGDEQRPAAPDFAAIVDVDLPKDLGQNKLLRGPEFEGVMAAIWAEHDAIAPEDFGAPGLGYAPEPDGLTHLWMPVALLGFGSLLAWASWDDGGWDGGLLVVFGLALAFAGLAGLWISFKKSRAR